MASCCSWTWSPLRMPTTLGKGRALFWNRDASKLFYFQQPFPISKAILTLMHYNGGERERGDWGLKSGLNTMRKKHFGSGDFLFWYLDMVIDQEGRRTNRCPIRQPWAPDRWAERHLCRTWVGQPHILPGGGVLMFSQNRDHIYFILDPQSPYSTQASPVCR